jgi:hypothetical protein
VRHWLGRWRASDEATPAAERLADAPRPGAPTTFTPEQTCAIGLRAPSAGERSAVEPLEPQRIGRMRRRAWHRREHLGSSVGRLFKEAALQPHRARGWLTFKPDPEFDTKFADICDVYRRAPEAAQEGVRVVSVDEMSGVQALERARRTEYKRHGTQTLIAAFDVVTGQVQGVVGDTAPRPTTCVSSTFCFRRVPRRRGGGW